MTEEIWALIRDAIITDDVAVLSAHADLLVAHEFMDPNGTYAIRDLLHLSIYHRSFDCAQWITTTAGGAHIERVSCSCTPLIRAVHTRDERFVRIILEAGAEIEKPSIDYHTALWIAMSYNTYRIACVLIDYGARLPVTGTLLSMACPEQIIAYYEAHQQKRARERALMAGLRAAGAHKDSIRLFQTEMRNKKR